MISTNVIITVATLLLTTTIYASNHEEAKELFDGADCMSCHNNEDFKARKEKTNNFKKLHKSVMACQINNNAGWFDDEAHSVSKFLNKKYYKFKDD